MKASIEIIVAMDRSGAIGKGGDMPWRMDLPSDLAHFKKTTLGYPVLMGRKTFFSLPKGALPNRKNIVVTRTPHKYTSSDHLLFFSSIEEALSDCEREEKIFVIGGEEIYKQLLPKANSLHITIVEHTFEEVDTFFPEIDLNEWECKSIEHFEADDRNKYAYSFTLWKRIHNEQ